MFRILRIKERLERKDIEIIRRKRLILFYSEQIDSYTTQVRLETGMLSRAGLYNHIHTLIGWKVRLIYRYTEELKRYTKELADIEAEIKELNLEITSLILSASSDTNFKF